ncbi:hypothetical protein TTRE_0000089401 [Trichuris trichiura]|uniref:Uncharacterized protein n=1 Tax=Trichuris trichiura TaxID=36087 RepID=A0A077YXA2_TRITR|nr:hypothetical protein TTRE_0000089401 [Trichuris trichiura]
MSFVRLVHPASCPLEGLDATMELCCAIEEMTNSLVRRFNVVLEKLQQRLETIGRRIDALENHLSQLPSRSNEAVTLSHPEICPWKTTIDNWAPSMFPLLDFSQRFDCCRQKSTLKGESSYALPVEEFDLQKALDRNSLPLSKPVSFVKEKSNKEDMVRLKYLSDLFIFNSTKTRLLATVSSFSLFNEFRYEKRYADSPVCRHTAPNGSLLISDPSSSRVVSQVSSKPNEIPELKLPESLPHLEGIASFPKETSTNSVKEELTQSDEDVFESGSSGASFMRESPVAFENKPMEPTLPAPPPPPPPVIESNSTPLPMSSPSRVDLMASIREAGGIERFKFKSRQHTKLRNSHSADPVGELKTAMEKRRKEIMGRSNGEISSESTAEALFRRLSANVPSNALNGSDGESSSKSNSDDEWSN